LAKAELARKEKEQEQEAENARVLAQKVEQQKLEEEEKLK
jgi:hypothetical protein